MIVAHRSEAAQEIPGRVVVVDVWVVAAIQGAVRNIVTHTHAKGAQWNRIQQRATGGVVVERVGGQTAAQPEVGTVKCHASETAVRNLERAQDCPSLLVYGIQPALIGAEVKRVTVAM